MRFELVLVIVVFLLITACVREQVSPQDIAMTESAQEVPKAEDSAQEAAEAEVLVNEDAAVDETSAVLEPVEESPPVTEVTFFDPELTYDGAYNGPLYATSEQFSNTAPIDKHIHNMNRNGVNVAITFMTIGGPAESGKLASHLGLGYMIDAVQTHPGRFVPFFNLGLPAESVGAIVGSQLTDAYKKNLEAAQKIVGKEVIQGIGELDNYGWSVSPADQRVGTLFDLAKNHDLAIMIHVAEGKVADLKRVVSERPDTVFLIHAFPEDFEVDRAAYIDLLKNNHNAFFSIDADHLMYDGKIGLLYKYEDYSDPQNAYIYNMALSGFVSEYDKKQDDLLKVAVAKYKPLVDAVPDKVMWGTEQGLAYTYEPQVYDRTIKFSRLFMGKMKPEHQEGLAYKNALRVFGTGATLTNKVDVIDSSSWENCDAVPAWRTCEQKCMSVGAEDSPESEACIQGCSFDNKCVESLEMD